MLAAARCLPSPPYSTVLRGRGWAFTPPPTTVTTETNGPQLAVAIFWRTLDTFGAWFAVHGKLLKDDAAERRKKPRARSFPEYRTAYQAAVMSKNL
ncbi:unnamed protein product [Phytophthora fragariaefolia]|uniref:Unnamed protein product n=1 Tax=Phytophthora fragariaefolia TaxID=1490495 RepID=A0A9W6TWT8_9STRA|nr:unnamed protein product [Phytophthora fragariaefolia]